MWKVVWRRGLHIQQLFEILFTEGIYLVTGIRNKMKNCLTNMSDKIMLRKRSVIVTINDERKNNCQIEHSRHRALVCNKLRR
ncbi:hypothetical protein EZ449_06000 [Pedobacter frigidisoli]|uniref:Transposase DDE domain-containing protein n=1 Tax=Pedobacter frigidisoli TaxID=2530455 RepID=A0A4R0P5U6_9SPHI|nr:hypothetical protein EZ449_06000 [Pedobacter frigidisoli]